MTRGSDCLNDNERWYLALTRVWASRLRAGGDPVGPARPAAEDVRFAIAALGLRAGAHVLDLACAWGRTTLELARQGYRVTGFDLSPDLLTLAREYAARARLDIPFIQGTVRRLPDLGRFDAVTAFYDDSVLSFEDEADNLAALRGVARALSPGGCFLFGTTDCPLLLPPWSCSLRNEADICIVEQIHFDAATLTGVSLRTQHYPDGHRESYRRVRRHYSADTAARLLARAGFSLRRAWCAYDESLPYGSRPEGMVLLAVRN